jgi:uncharacterized LabA/DUF88 family protein
MPRGKTIAFIDNSNVFMGQLSAGWRIDVDKLKSVLERDGEIWQTFFFASVTNPPRYQQTNFYRFIKNHMRFEVSLYKLGRKTTRCRNCNRSWTVPVEKGVDVGLATKLLSLASHRAFETALLIAADRDYLETVQAVKNMGMRVEIIAWRGTISPQMENESSAPVLFFDDMRYDIELTTEPDREAEELSSGEIDEDEEPEEHTTC